VTPTIPELVSVIIPTRGTRPELLSEAVGSLPDGITLYLAQNSGKLDMAEAMNMALEQVETPFVYVMGDDDLLEEDTITRLVEGIGTADVAYPTIQLFGKKDDQIFADMFSIHRLQQWNYISGSSLFRVSKLREVEGWRATPVEDWDVVYRLAHAGARFEAVPTAIYHYRIHESLSHDIVKTSNSESVSTSDLRADMGFVKEDLLATFYGQASRGVGYVRGVLPAKHLPGIYRSTVEHEDDVVPPEVAVWLHPAAMQRKYIDEHRERGRKLVIDVDDDYVSPAFDATLRRWGLDAVADQWSPEERAGHRDLVREADAVICSTAHLADRYADLNSNVHVCLNSVDPDDWAPPPRRDPTQPIRVGWAAAKQHWPDAALVEPALRWASKQKHVQVVVIGVEPDFDFDYIHVPFTPTLTTYRDWLGVIDIGLAPVKGGAMNDAKSDLKFLEYTMAGALTIASCRPAYAMTVRHGETGVLAKNARDFRYYVEQAVRDEDTRMAIVRNAARYVASCRLASQNADAYRSVLATIGVLEPMQAVA
jgi:glycosyltransferase involved in cell wall biosynthesis